MVVVSAVSLSGLLILSLNPKWLEKHLHILVSFAAGSLFGDAFIHLLPESFARAENPLSVSLLALLGILVFLMVERFIISKHRHGEHEHRGLRPVVFINLISDGVHNFIDGLLIGASFLVSPTLGAATFVAVLLHEIPQEIGDFGILVHGGLSYRKAIAFNLLTAASAILGVVVSLLAGPQFAGYSEAMLPVTAGGFIYIAGSNLVPDLIRQARPGTFIPDILAMAAGVSIMAALAAQ